MTNPGLLVKRYCALCDYHYPKGHWAEHKTSDLHKTCLRDSEAMANWYRKNGG